MMKIELSIYQKHIMRRLKSYTRPIAEEIIKQAYPEYRLRKVRRMRGSQRKGR
jgi:anaerobic ribonucleoside-triphosphate reductase